MRIARTVRATVTASLAVLVTAAVVQAMSFGAWSPAVNAETISGTSGDLNTAALEGCPFVAQRGDVLYFASSRADGRGGNDIWYSLRGANGAWSAPINFAAVNTTADELCPAAHRNGKTFLFVRSGGACGLDDIFITRRHATRGWAPPTNLGCTVNSAGKEASPYLLESELYFSSTRPGGYSSAAPNIDGDIYVSAFDGVSFGTPALVPGVNTASDDSRPNLRRDGLELFFESNRPGYTGTTPNLDLWSSTRASTSSSWLPPRNLGSAVNSSANDLRASLSWDGTTLYFGSFRTGAQQDLYVTTRP